MINFNPNAIKTNDDVLRVVSCNVLEASQKLPEGSQEVKGYDFSDESVDYDALLKSYYTTGFQATNFAIAVDIIKDMLDWRPSKAQIEDDTSPDARCSIFLGYTSNMVSSGVRETIKFLVKTKQVDVIVTTAGAIEEDIMKCLAPTGLGDFRLDGAMLREKGLNRIGNLLIPNNNYCNFEDWCLPVLDKALEIQKKEGIIHTPSSIIKLFGENIHNEDSVLYWAAKNDIPVFCPAITDGAIGDLMFIHSIKNPGLIVDLVQDIGNINRLSIRAAALGMIIVGGGIIKHHICNAALMRNGANFAVYVNTGQEFDGSDAGASPEEAVSWGKIEPKARRVKICADATLILPLLVAQTFAQKDRKNGRN